MKAIGSCPLEERIVLGLRGSGLTPQLDQHRTECRTCGDLAAAEEFMARFSRLAIPARHLPEAAIIWLRAQLLRNRAAAKEATRPLGLVQKLVWGFVSIAWVALFAWQWPGLLDWAEGVNLSSLLEGSIEAVPVSARFLWIFAGLMVLTMTLTVQMLLDEA